MSLNGAGVSGVVVGGAWVSCVNLKRRVRARGCGRSLQHDTAFHAQSRNDNTKLRDATKDDTTR